GIPYSVCGGGRYDNLISLYGGPDIPCVGMSFGVDRLVEAAMEKRIIEVGERRPVFVAYIGQELKPLALKTARDLRMAGIKTDVELRERPLSKQLEYANKRGCKLAVLLGKRELERKAVKIRDLDSGEELEIPLDRLIEEIRGKLA
ncbi:MAG: histidine--tRNA ligase, partial [Thermoproteota archaeon]